MPQAFPFKLCRDRWAHKIRVLRHKAGVIRHIEPGPGALGRTEPLAEILDEIVEPKLHVEVTKHMIHRPCGVFNNNSLCIVDGKCSKQYSRDLFALNYHRKFRLPITSSTISCGRWAIGSCEVSDESLYKQQRSFSAHIFIFDPRKAPYSSPFGSSSRKWAMSVFQSRERAR
ncbi:hypothetical protein EVAR_29745_1 [Eumeta japonica]|uniref:Uncharacterized protein n=1 Tax=Eumeta variegata TaxID=151549 RepID=A0A4C1WVG8_EUMVA|nr:hypothetical protein EVAR_29745_1 [Eumeta japonica]